MNLLRAADRTVADSIERLVWKLRSVARCNHPMMLSMWRIGVVTLILVSIGLTLREDLEGGIVTLCAAGFFIIGVLRDLRATWNDGFEPWTPRLYEKYAKRSAFQRHAFPWLRLGCATAACLSTAAHVAWSPTGEGLAAPTLLMFWFLTVSGYVECSRPELPTTPKTTFASA